MISLHAYKDTIRQLEHKYHKYIGKNKVIIEMVDTVWLYRFFVYNLSLALMLWLLFLLVFFSLADCDLYSIASIAIAHYGIV